MWLADWQARDELQQENEALRSRVELQAEQLSTMRSHLGIIRQHTITFILDQMDTLHMQRDTEVWQTTTDGRTDDARVYRSAAAGPPLTKHQISDLVDTGASRSATLVTLSILWRPKYFLVDWHFERLKVCVR